MSMQAHEHKTIFYCAGGQCQVDQCVYCVSLLRAMEEPVHDHHRCLTCGMLYDLCSCTGNKLNRR